MSQQISFEALANAFAPIESIGRDEMTFEAEGVPVTIRVLLPEEENVVQRWAAEKLPENSEQGDAGDFIERFKLGMLSYAVIGAGQQDFRDVDFVETGETLPNGAKVKIARNLAMRKVLLKWSGALRTRIFNKYAELLKKMEIRAEQAILYEPSDLDTEIERLEQRLKELKADQERLKAPHTPTDVFIQTQAIADQDADARQERQDVLAKFATARADVSQEALAEEAGLAVEQLDSSQLQIPRPRAAAWSQTAPATPPQEKQTQPVESMPQVQQPQQVQQFTKPLSQDSFVDSSDPESLMAEAEAETNRLIAMRKKAMEAQRAVVPEPIPVSRPVGRPPHLDAAETIQDMGLDSEETRILQEARTSRITPSGTVDGIPAYRNPTEALERRAPQPPQAGGQVQLNSVPQNQGRNPRFQPPKKI